MRIAVIIVRRIPALFRRVRSATVLTGLFLLATPAAACPRCFGASEGKSLVAYFASAAALSLLPLAIVGVVGFVIYRSGKRTPPHSSNE